MKQKILFLLFLVTYGLTVLGQTQEKIYYDENWKVTNKSNAAYYRLITFDGNGKPLGKVKDYYISGELQWEGYLSYVDKYDNSKDIAEGHCIWYYKNGKKEREVDFKMGVPNGIWIDYYENGKLFRKFNFSDGKLIDKFFTECDEFGKCQKVFYESFASEENINDWPLVKNEKNYKSSIIAEKGLLMETKTDTGFRQTINIPLSLSEDFSIETIIDLKSGEKNSGHGLLWGFKDWDNYYYFYISGNGYYRIGAITEGIDLEFVKWTQTNTLNQDYQRNRIKVLRVKDKMYFSINGSLVHSEDFYTFRGNNIGLLFFRGKNQYFLRT